MAPETQQPSQLEDYPRRIEIGSDPKRMYEMVPGELVLHFRSGVSEEDIQQVFKQGRLFDPEREMTRDESAVFLKRVVRRVLRRATWEDAADRAKEVRSTTMRVARITRPDKPINPQETIEQAVSLRAKYSEHLRLASPVYIESGRKAVSAVIPVHDRIVVSATTESGARHIREIAEQHNLRVRDVLGELIADSRARETDVDQRNRIDWVEAYAGNGYPFPLLLTATDVTANGFELLRSLQNEFAAHAGVASTEFDWRQLRKWQVHTPDEWKPGTFQNFEQINARAAWEIQNGHPDIVVALLDSGFDLNHAELEKAYSDSSLHFDTETWSDLNGPPDGEDYDVTSDDDHGTLVAGIVGASHDVCGGALGLAPDCSIMPIKLGKIPSALEIGVGLLWACVNGASVANLSLETVPIAADESVLSLVSQAGMLVVAATGNDESATGIAFPASHPDVVAVGASRDDGLNVTLANTGDEWSSQSGPGINVVAPGLNVTSTVPGTGTASDFQGTSASAPHVAALAALLFSHNPMLTSGLVREAILSTCDFRGNVAAASMTLIPGTSGVQKPWDADVGFGRVDSRAALDWVARLKPGDIEQAKEAQSMAASSAKKLANNRLGNLMKTAPLYDADEQQDLAIIHAANQEGSGMRVLEGFAFVPLRRNGSIYGPDAALPAGSSANANANAGAGGGSGGSKPDGSPKPGGYTHIRLYLDASSMSWVDVRADDVRVLRRYAKDRTPLGRIYMLVSAGARLRYGRNESVDEFLQGSITQDMRYQIGDDDGLNSVIALLRSLTRGRGVDNGGDGGYSTGRGPC